VAPLALAAKAFLTLFVVMDPVGLGPVFLALAGERTPEEQRAIAARAVGLAAGLLAFFGLFGAPLLAYLGIGLGAFRVAGGLLLFKIAVDMVFASRVRETPEEEEEARVREDISVFPLAIPLLVGPGAMASILVLAAEAKGVPGGPLWLAAAAGAVLLLAYLALLLAGAIARGLGRTGVNVVTRVLGVLLAALAVQYVFDGVWAYFVRG